MLAGFGFVLAALSLAAKVLNLTVITELLQSSSTFLVIALVVIFQPELRLRRIFAEVGSRPLIGSHRQQTEVIESVIGALERLQQSGHGALIAFEREITYGPARENGTLLDARVSDDLLSTLFFPKTPLHDGGAIIVQDRVAVAAAIFPLTQAEGLQRALGLRHRAALGLSDETDAVVVVLSEETGIISLAIGGEMRRPLTTTNFAPSSWPSSKTTMQKTWLNNWPAKLVSLIIALVIWAYVKNIVQPAFSISS